MFHRETNIIATEVKHWRCWTRRLFLGSYCKLYLGICRDPSGKVELVRPRGSFEAAAALICDSLPCFEVGFQEQCAGRTEGGNVLRSVHAIHS